MGGDGDNSRARLCVGRDHARSRFRGRDQVISFIREGFDAAAARDEPDVRSEFSTAELGVYEYTSRGKVDRARATVFAKRLTGGRRIITGTLAGILSWAMRGKAFEVPVCFVYHVNDQAQIDRVNEYVGKRAPNDSPSATVAA
jgi:hypothetical protein